VVKPLAPGGIPPPDEVAAAGGSAVLPFDLIGRHRAPGPRRVALRLAIPRHSDPPFAGPVESLKRTKWLFFGVLVVVALAVGVGLPRRSPDRAAPAAALPVPSFTVAPPPTVTPSSDPGSDLALQRRRTVRQLPPPTTAGPTKAGPTKAGSGPVLLGPDDLGGSLTGYCQQAYGQFTGAFLTRDGWECLGLLQRPHSIDLGDFCRSVYGRTATAHLIDTRDQQSWRCYRSGS
jgi:hypothetical protein